MGEPAAVLTVWALARVGEDLSNVFADSLGGTALQGVLCSCIDPGETNVVLGSNTI